MNRKFALLVGLLGLVLCVGVVSASYSKSFVYTLFNSADWSSEYVLDTQYEKWEVKLINVLTYNSTTSGTATLKINGTVAEDSYVDVCLVHSGVVEVWWSDAGGDAVKIGAGSWVKSEAIYLSLDSKGYFDFGNSTDKDAYISDFVMGDLTYNSTLVKGETDNVLSGFVSIEVSTASFDSSSMGESVKSWMPVILEFMMLGIAIGMVKKFRA